MCQLRNKVELQFLPPYQPSNLEQSDPVLFANNVRQEMADALGVPLCDMTFEDIKNKYGKKEPKKDQWNEAVLNQFQLGPRLWTKNQLATVTNVLIAE